jgi:hypothetical protein
MKSKIAVLIVNAIYLLGTILWAFSEKSSESFVAILGGVVSFVSFFVGNDNSFDLKKNSIIQKGSNSTAIIGDVNNSNVGNINNNKQ